MPSSWGKSCLDSRCSISTNKSIETSKVTISLSQRMELLRWQILVLQSSSRRSRRTGSQLSEHLHGWHLNLSKNSLTMNSLMFGLSESSQLSLLKESLHSWECLLWRRCISSQRRSPTDSTKWNFHPHTAISLKSVCKRMLQSVGL